MSERYDTDTLIERLRDSAFRTMGHNGSYDDGEEVVLLERAIEIVKGGVTHDK